MGRLQNRRAVVTGAASGIGAATCALFAAEGAAVLAVDRADLGTLPDGAHPLVEDLAAEGAAARIVDAARTRLGGVDILFNNAGVSGYERLDDLEAESFERTLAVNLGAAVRLTKAALPELRRSGAGRVINTASVMAEGADFGLAAYCASKAGLLGFTRVAALELGRDGVTVNAVLPGAIETGMTRESFSRPEVAAVWAKKSPLRRLGQPLDVARVVLFLASEEAGFVTGQAIAVDGGMRLRV